MMWIKVFDVASSSFEGGRVNLANVMALLVSGSASTWVVNAKLLDGTSVRVSDDLPSRSDAQVEADQLILNGS